MEPLFDSSANIRLNIVNPTLKWQWGYYPEIDGLRTFAVLSVFLFHLFRNTIGGGFVGVDIFFVISGFLISSVLLQDIDKRQFSILRFYQHRIARIAPALFLVLALTLSAAALLYSAQDFASTAAGAASAAISAINIKLLFQGDYFHISRDAQPLLHYWSLAVEEQFYLLFPSALYVLMRYARRPLAVTLVFCGLSFAFCIVLAETKPAFAFYLLPTRAWELLAGCSLALFRYGGGTTKTAHAETLGWVGLAILTASVLFIEESRSFPGWVAGAPVAGTVMVLGSVGYTNGAISRVLAHPAVVFIGKRSYSLYLWHWPTFCFVDYALFLSPVALRVFLKVALSVCGTLFAYAFFERPARRYLNRPGNRNVGFAGFAALVVAILVIGIVVRHNDYLSASPGSIASGGIVVNKCGKQSVVMIGDSQGAMYGKEMASIAQEMGFRLNVLSVAGGSELAGEPNSFWPKVEQFLAREHADVIVVAEAWSDKLGRDSAALRRAVAALTPFGRTIIIVDQPPIVPPAASREAMRNGAGPLFFEQAEDRSLRLKSSQTVSALKQGNIDVVHVADIFLQQNGSVRVIGENGRLNFMDARHLSDTGTQLVHSKLVRALATNLRKITRQ